MKECEPFSEELIEYVFNPDRMISLSNKYNMDFMEFISAH